MKINKAKAKEIIIVAVCVCIIGAFAYTVHAQTSTSTLKYEILAPLPGIDSETASNLPSYLIAMFKLMIGLAALLAVVQITIGGIEYMTSETLGGKGDGRQRITQAITGLVLAIASWLILYTVNPKLVEFNLALNPPTTIQTVATAGGTWTLPPGFPEEYPDNTWYKIQYCRLSNGTQRTNFVAGQAFSFNPFDPNFSDDPNDNSVNSIEGARRQCVNQPPIVGSPPNGGSCSILIYECIRGAHPPPYPNTP